MFVKPLLVGARGVGRGCGRGTEDTNAVIEELVSRETTSSEAPRGTKECAEIAHEELGLFEAGEVPAARHDRPVNDLVVTFGPGSRRPAVQHFLWEHGNPGGDLDASCWVRLSVALE